MSIFQVQSKSQDMQCSIRTSQIEHHLSGTPRISENIGPRSIPNEDNDLRDNLMS